MTTKTRSEAAVIPDKRTIQPDGCVIVHNERFRVPEQVYPWPDTDVPYDLKPGEELEVVFDAGGQLHGYLPDQGFEFKLQRCEEEVVVSSSDGTEVPFNEVEMTVVAGEGAALDAGVESPPPALRASSPSERGTVDSVEHVIRPRLSREQWTLLAHYLDTRIDQLYAYLSDEEEMHDGREQAMEMMRTVKAEQRWSMVPIGLQRAIEDTIRLCRREWEIHGRDYAYVYKMANSVTPEYLMDFVMQEVYRDAPEGGLAA